MVLKSPLAGLLAISALMIACGFIRRRWGQVHCWGNRKGSRDGGLVGFAS